MDNTRKPRALTDLPVELLWMISEHLSPADVACLTLCSHHLIHCFIKSAFHGIPNGRTGGSGDDTRIDLLSRLSRDLPQYYLCYACLRLHIWNKIELPRPGFDVPDCCKSLPVRNWYLRRPIHLISYPCYSDYEFHFVHLHLAMRRFYYGPQFGIPVESLLYREVVAYTFAPKLAVSLGFPPPSLSNEEYQRNYITALMSVDARICTTPPSLCLRMQQLAVVRKQNIARFFPNPEKTLVRVCMHSNISELPYTVHSLIERYSSDEAVTKLADQGRCGKCNTAYKMEIRDLGQKDACFVFTVWMDLGPGLTPDDYRWRCHLDYEHNTLVPDDELVVDPRARFEKDSIQAHYPDALSDEAMYYRNISFLQKTDWSVMTRKDLSRWFLRAGDAEKRTSTRCVVL